MLGFFFDIFNGNQVNLIVQCYDENSLSDYDLKQIKQSGVFYETDSIQDAIQHFGLYTKGNGIYKYTADEMALSNLGITNEEASDFREKINALIQNMDDETAAENAILFPNWNSEGNYKVDDKVRYNGILYKVLQAHTANAIWTPDAAPSLFSKVLVSEDSNEILDWEQPDSTNPYKTGDKVRFEGQIYESLIDNNVWSPKVYPQSWKLVEE
jgi:hypothetical protein